MYSWLRKNITNSFDFVDCLKKSDLSRVEVYRNKATGQKVIVRSINDVIDVYQKLMQVSAKHIPTIYEVAKNEDYPAYEIPDSFSALKKDLPFKAIVIEEFISGINVGDVLTSGTYTEEGMRVVIDAVCEALETLHSLNIIHRDIKPENVMISDDGEVYLIDFNSSRVYKNEAGKDTHILGTHGFAAPEQYGIGQTDMRSDVYAVGVLMNVMLTGEHPTQHMYKGKYSKVINRCIQSDPNKRFSSITELREYL